MISRRPLTIKSYDWYEILKALHLDPPIDGGEYQIICPLHDEHRPSCSINVDTGKWICFAGCGAGDLQLLVKLMRKTTASEARTFVEQHGMYRIPTPSDLFKHVVVDEDKPLPEIPFPFEKGRVPKWVYKRGINKESLIRWEAGVDDKAGLALPVRDANQRMVGWVLRQRVAEPKYLYYPGMKKSKVLFGQHLLPEHVDVLYVVEGSLDAISLDQYGYSVVSLLGSMISAAQVNLLRNIKADKIVLVLDNDEAGQKGTKKGLTQLREYGIVKYVKLPKHVKDIQEVRDANAIKEVLTNTYSW
jgi:5S rRNA maturation endonuclease (ribonuclease M5)